MNVSTSNNVNMAIEFRTVDGLDSFRQAAKELGIQVQRIGKSAESIAYGLEPKERDWVQNNAPDYQGWPRILGPAA